MKSFKNTIHLEGYVYDLNRLEKKVSGPNSKKPGTEFIQGDIYIATDDECMNTVQVHFSYVTATNSKGRPNENYNILNGLIDGTLKTVMNSSQEQAAKVRWDGRISLLDFLPRDSEEMTTTKRLDGGFMHLATTLNEEKLRNRFDTDMLITRVREVEADEDRGTPHKAIISGYIFEDYSKSILPVDYSILNEGGINYFMSQDISSKNPILTEVWGRVISQTQVSTRTTESAWGEEKVDSAQRTEKDYVITGMSKVPMEWGDESVLTANDVKEMLSKREVYLAGEKQRTLAYRNNSAVPAASATDEYDF